MLKKFSVLALAGMLCLPTLASAGGGAADLGRQIDELQRQLEQLKEQMAEMQENTEENFEELDERAESWDLASRFHWSGDFRARYDFVTADTASHYAAIDVGQGVANVLDAGTSFNTILGGFGFTGATPVANLAGALNGLNTAQVSAAFQATGVSQTRADVLAVIFTDPGVGQLLQGLVTQGATISSLTGAFSNLENLVGFMKNLTPANRAAIFSGLGFDPRQGRDIDNDSIMTNRLRLNLRVKATEDVEFKGRLAMYKVWGMQNNAVDQTFNNGLGGGPFLLSSLAFDGSRTRQPDDSALYVDRAFVNWNNIAGLPVWFSIGRRPTTDGPPAQLRLGADQRLATPVGYFDYPFDGATIGYAYLGLPGLGDFPGRIRFCYGRGFENGPTDDGHSFMGKDTDFAGINWDVYKKGDRFFNLQSFGAFNIFNVPDNVTFGNPIELGFFQLNADFFDPIDPSADLILNRADLGNIWHNSFVYLDKIQSLNYFLVGGWSKTQPKGVDELGTSLLGSFFEDPKGKDGFSVYAGVRYDMPDYRLKIGAEYNYGSKDWISFTPAHDELYASKLATRGHVTELYGIWDIPAGEAVSKFGKAFIRAGWLHYEYNYTGSGFWLGEPVDIDETATDPLLAQFWEPVDNMDQIYVTLEAWF